MQATKSAKAKLRLHDTSSPGQQGSDKTIRRYSLPSSSNNARVTSDFPETTRGSNLGGKTGKRPKKLNEIDQSRRSRTKVNYGTQVSDPNMALKIWDMAIQVHGAAGVCSDTF
ncbi:hypothetical protein Bca52824_047039 [Brassica carinata]|uniref:Uncharacterized protein n=1 Tax=Brassica carinata TaxID=52824 RepID=A0A8X7RFU7_BRACI|nr:hypothetical protein Bca52824_047039 [Brassica carinata]